MTGPTLEAHSSRVILRKAVPSKVVATTAMVVSFKAAAPMVVVVVSKDVVAVVLMVSRVSVAKIPEFKTTSTINRSTSTMLALFVLSSCIGTSYILTQSSAIQSRNALTTIDRE